MGVWIIHLDRGAKPCFAWPIERRFNGTPVKTEGLHRAFRHRWLTHS